MPNAYTGDAEICGAVYRWRSPSAGPLSARPRPTSAQPSTPTSRPWSSRRGIRTSSGWDATAAVRQHQPGQRRHQVPGLQHRAGHPGDEPPGPAPVGGRGAVFAEPRTTVGSGSPGSPPGCIPQAAIAATSSSTGTTPTRCSAPSPTLPYAGRPTAAPATATTMSTCRWQRTRALNSMRRSLAPRGAGRRPPPRRRPRRRSWRSGRSGRGSHGVRRQLAVDPDGNLDDDALTGDGRQGNICSLVFASASRLYAGTTGGGVYQFVYTGTSSTWKRKPLHNAGRRGLAGADAPGHRHRG